MICSVHQVVDRQLPTYKKKNLTGQSAQFTRWHKRLLKPFEQPIKLKLPSLAALFKPKLLQSLGSVPQLQVYSALATGITIPPFYILNHFILTIQALVCSPSATPSCRSPAPTSTPPSVSPAASPRESRSSGIVLNLFWSLRYSELILVCTQSFHLVQETRSLKQTAFFFSYQIEHFWS